MGKLQDCFVNLNYSIVLYLSWCSCNKKVSLLCLFKIWVEVGDGGGGGGSSAPIGDKCGGGE